MKLNNFKKFVLNYGQHKVPKLFCFFALSLIAGVLEFFGLALIYPFIIMIITPEVITNNSYYIQFANILKIEDPTIIAFIIGFSILTIFIIKNVYIILNSYIQTKFVTNWKKDLSQQFMELFLYASYKKIMQISNSDKLYIITTLIPQTIDGFVMRGLNLLTNSIIVFMIIGLLFVKFPLAASITILFVMSSMFLQNKYFKDKMQKLSIILNEKSQKYNKILLETINNLKETKILSAEDKFFKSYGTREDEMREIQIINGFYSSIPPYIIEILIVVSLLLLGSVISIKNLSNNSALVASYAIVAAAIFRIAPALNRIQTSILNINASRDFVRRLNDYHELFNDYKHSSNDNVISMEFHDKIEITDLNFEYEPAKPVLKQLSLTINKGDFIGIIGLSGAGKSTLADIIMGLLPIQSGMIKVDNTPLDENSFVAFRKIIGYVPQQINVLDTTFKENVTWCSTYTTDEEEDTRVIQALKDAQLYDIVNKYVDGIYSKPLVNSTGLSQGQKQRLAIARALYRNPEIIILDEATSSLDVQTEYEITEMLQRICTNKTIIAIAHRLSTLKACNKLVYLKDGCIVDVGSFEELSQKHADFENLVKLSTLSK